MSETESKKRLVVKSVANARLYDDGTVLLMNVRASHPYVVRPQEGKDDQGRPTGVMSWSITGLMPKATHGEAKALLDGEIAKILAVAKLKAIADDRKFLRDGDGQAKDELRGMWTAAAREKSMPRLRHANKRPVDPKTEGGLFYGGCWVNIVLRPWFQSNGFGKRVNANLYAVQFVRDDEAFGQGRISEETIDDTFDSVEADDADDEM